MVNLWYFFNKTTFLLLARDNFVPPRPGTRLSLLPEYPPGKKNLQEDGREKEGEMEKEEETKQEDKTDNQYETVYLPILQSYKNNCHQFIQLMKTIHKKKYFNNNSHTKKFFGLVAALSP